MSEGREPFGREKTARRGEPNFAPPQLGVLIEESVKECERESECISLRTLVAEVFVSQL